MAAHGHFHWNELLTGDVERAKKFYAETLGWSFLPLPTETGDIYWVARLGDTPVAGIFPLDKPGFEDVQERWMSYIAVDDVDARVEKAIAAGAKLMRPIFDVPGVGRIAILAEPGGAGIGWITPAKL